MEKYLTLQLTSSSDIGGTERMLVQLLSSWNRNRFDAHVSSLVGSGTLTKMVRELGYEGQTVGLANPVQWKRWRSLYRIMKSRPFDLLHTYGLRADTVGRFLGHMAGIPIIISSIRSPDPWRRWYHVLLDHATMRWADCFISNSECGKISRIRRERYSPGLIQTVYNGIPAPRPYPGEELASLREKYGIGKDAWPVVAHVANLRVMKGHRDILAALPELKEKFPDILFIFAGRDDSHGEIEKTAVKRKLANHVRFPGYCPEPAEILAICDIFILPSHWEGCPTSLLEAMAREIPCVATKVGGIPEILQNRKNGLLIPPRNPRAITAAVSFMAENPAAAREMAADAAATVRERFSLDRMVAEYENIYAEMIEARRCR